MNECAFEVSVSTETAVAFAELSGDWNPLHTDPAYAASTGYGKPILHGAFAAGLASRMAGMHLPGTECLLHSLQLKFVSPITPPADLRVTGRLAEETEIVGRVQLRITDAGTGNVYVEGSYSFSRHSRTTEATTPKLKTSKAKEGGIVLVTGASGAVGSSVISRLGATAVPLTRPREHEGHAHTAEHWDAQIRNALDGRPLAGIVHCGWPKPDNSALITNESGRQAIDHYVGATLHQAVELARAVKLHGSEGATLILLGSTAALPGRHNYKAPLYALGKSMVPTLVRILALELAPTRHRVIGLTLDVLDGGMNAGMSKLARAAHLARSPHGSIAAPMDIAEQIAWLLSSPSTFLSGATIELSGGAMP